MGLPAALGTPKASRTGRFSSKSCLLDLPAALEPPKASHTQRTGPVRPRSPTFAPGPHSLLPATVARTRPCQARCCYSILRKPTGMALTSYLGLAISRSRIGSRRVRPICRYIYIYTRADRTRSPTFAPSPHSLLPANVARTRPCRADCNYSDVMNSRRLILIRKGASLDSPGTQAPGPDPGQKIENPRARARGGGPGPHSPVQQAQVSAIQQQPATG